MHGVFDFRAFAWRVIAVLSVALVFGIPLSVRFTGGLPFVPYRSLVLARSECSSSQRIDLYIFLYLDQWVAHPPPTAH